MTLVIHCHTPTYHHTHIDKYTLHTHLHTLKLHTLTLTLTQTHTHRHSHSDIPTLKTHTHTTTTPRDPQIISPLSSPSKNKNNSKYFCGDFPWVPVVTHTHTYTHTHPGCYWSVVIAGGPRCWVIVFRDLLRTGCRTDPINSECEIFSQNYLKKSRN